ncbi:MAG: ATP-binding protein [Cytophagaceae bacterium]
MELETRQAVKTGEQTFSNPTPVTEEGLKAVTDNLTALGEGINWLSQIIRFRCDKTKENRGNIFEKIADIPELSMKTSLGKLALAYQLSNAEKLLLLLTYTAQFKPGILDVFLLPNKETRMRTREYGGVVDNTDGKFVPTLQTLIFLLAGQNDTKAGIYFQQIMGSILFKEQIIKRKSIKPGFDHPLHQVIELDLAYYNYLNTGKKPHFEESEDFPATLLTTSKTLEDLILKPATMEQLQGPMNFVKYYDTLFGDEENKRILRPGYVVMLYGPPGTGKTMTVSVIGKFLNVEVYAVNLARVVSKYIGETEKNLEKIFNKLEGKKCILFFDEADALFGKRTEVQDAKDRYANQEVAYLLQKIEQFQGLVILASNFKQNLDDAFKRRILTSIFIPPPDKELREILWNKAVPPAFSYEPEDLPVKLAEKHSLTGANIANVIKLSCIEAISRQSYTLTKGILEPFIQQELLKEGKHK